MHNRNRKSFYLNFDTKDAISGIPFNCVMKCDQPVQGKLSRIYLRSLELPITWYNVRSPYNTMTVSIVSGSTYTITVAEGVYTISTLLPAIQTQLINATNYNWTLAQTTYTNKVNMTTGGTYSGATTTITSAVGAYVITSANQTAYFNMDYNTTNPVTSVPVERVAVSIATGTYTIDQLCSAVQTALRTACTVFYGNSTTLNPVVSYNATTSRVTITANQLISSQYVNYQVYIPFNTSVSGNYLGLLGFTASQSEVGTTLLYSNLIVNPITATNSYFAGQTTTTTVTTTTTSSSVSSTAVNFSIVSISTDLSYILGFSNAQSSSSYTLTSSNCFNMNYDSYISMCFTNLPTPFLNRNPMTFKLLVTEGIGSLNYMSNNQAFEQYISLENSHIQISTIGLQIRDRFNNIINNNGVHFSFHLEFVFEED